MRKYNNVIQFPVKPKDEKLPLVRIRHNILGIILNGYDKLSKANSIAERNKIIIEIYRAETLFNQTL